MSIIEDILDYLTGLEIQRALGFVKENWLFFVAFIAITAIILLNKRLGTEKKQHVLDKSARYGEGIKAFFLRNLIWIVIGTGFFSGLIVLAADLPNAAQIAYLWFLVIGFFFYIPVKRHVRAMFQPKRYPLIEFRAEEDYFRMYELTPNQWNKLKLKNPQEYDLSRYKSKNGFVYFCRNLDTENLVAEGTWIGALDDLELLDQKENIEKLRKRIRDEVNKARYFRNHQYEIINESVAQIVADIVSGVEENTIHKGEYIQEVVDDVMSDYEERHRVENRKKAKKTELRQKRGSENEGNKTNTQK